MHKNLFTTCAAAFMALALVSSCTVGPDYHRPSVEVPPRWAQSSNETQRSSESPQELSRWWSLFQDDQLDSLMERALEGNKDLKLAAAKILEARAQRRVTAADAYPNIGSGAGYRRVRTSENVARSSLVHENDLFDMGFDALWEVDLFGGVRRAVEAADARIASSEENRRDVMVSLASEVARNYLEVRGDQRRIQIAQDNILVQRQTLELTQARFQAGLSNELEVAQAEAQLASTESQIPSLESAAQSAVHRLGVLLGMTPESLLLELSSPMPIPEAPPGIPAVLPSELLRRRPDVRRAERDAAEATANIGVATADLFPRFSLTGALTLESTKASDFISMDSRAWSFGPSVRWPVFDAGRIRGNIAVQNARQEQALAVYEQTVLQALEDVETAMVAYSKELARRKTLQETVRASRKAVDISNELYARGVLDFLNVLVNQRALYQAQDQLVVSDQLIATDLVALYKALGGGWDPEKADPF